VLARVPPGLLRCVELPEGRTARGATAAAAGGGGGETGAELGLQLCEGTALGIARCLGGCLVEVVPQG